jgi:hypothetical protein
VIDAASRAALGLAGFQIVQLSVCKERSLLYSTLLGGLRYLPAVDIKLLLPSQIKSLGTYI